MCYEGVGKNVTKNRGRKVKLRKFSSKRNQKLILLMQTEPGSIPGSGEALAKFSRNYAELYWEFNEPISRPVGGQEVPRNGELMCPFIHRNLL